MVGKKKANVLGRSLVKSRLNNRPKIADSDMVSLNSIENVTNLHYFQFYFSSQQLQSKRNRSSTS